MSRAAALLVVLTLTPALVSAQKDKDQKRPSTT